jgi:chromatin segregation and condensation protein Rec8/ScpA/Scc1 (kleisin family)
VEVLVTFLAILELVRQGQITAWQEGTGGDIFLLARDTSPEGASGQLGDPDTSGEPLDGAGRSR